MVRVRIVLSRIQQRVAEWLRQGMSPRRLALTLALGFAMGCLPVLGLPTALCVLLAVVLRLNLPAIQAANYAVMPLQLLLIAPFVRFGGWLVSLAPRQNAGVRALLHVSPMSLAWHVTSFAAEALLAWLVIAVPAVVLMTAALTLLLRRVPVLGRGEQVSGAAGQQVSAL
jgi:uncharacterized protein (DUF2062 family)